MATERQPTASARVGSSSKDAETDGSGRVGRSRAEPPSAGTKSAIRDIIRRYRETFDRLAR